MLTSCFPTAAGAPSPCSERDASIPRVFCWTKMGAEAGQALSDIIRRKDLERACGDGVFAWGIGNSVGPAIKHAKTAERVAKLEALFTPMRSMARTIDSAPASVVLWTSYYDSFGEVQNLPDHMLITSRGHLEGGDEKRGHYALLCYSQNSLIDQSIDAGIDHRRVRNLVSSNPVGSSQVTSVVRYEATESCETTYPVLFRAELTGQAFIKLARPFELRGELLKLYRYLGNVTSVDAWRSGVLELRSSQINAPNVRQASLFS